jgi:hypothetical protein
MARLNVYLPDELAAAAKASSLNLSAVTQEAVRRCLDARSTDAWLSTLHRAPRHRVTGSPGHRVTHDSMVDALDTVREEPATRHG